MKLRRLRTWVLVAGLAAGTLLAGCGAGPDAATGETRPSIPGVDADAGDIHVRNAVVTFNPEGYAPGEDAPVTLSIGNVGQDTVRLVGVTSESAGSVTVASVTQVGLVSPPPGGAPGGQQVEVAPGQLVAVTLTATGLREPLTGAAVLPLTLTFDTGAELALEVPVAPPDQPLPRPEPVVEAPEH
ncbi:MAG TPA: hypothetical protein VIL37_18485 [Natronosporangium sp.]